VPIWHRTHPMADSPTDVRLTATQVRTLEALARPFSTGGEFATPATDEEIAGELFLSVDAVQGHLRALDRKFGIEDLPPDRRRARLAELAIAGEPYLPDVPLATVPRATPVGTEDEEKSWWPYFTFGILILVVIGGTLSISGIFNTGSTTPPPPSAAEYRAEVTEECKLALEGAPAPGSGQDRAELAADYLKVVTAMRTGFESLITPAIPDIALERFGNGLRNAATYTSDVAAGPPVAGSKAEAKAVAELHRAAGQIRTGATGYGLGEECVALGDLVARSAQNAAAS
jgi:hypothetical protein